MPYISDEPKQFDQSVSLEAENLKAKKTLELINFHFSGNNLAYLGGGVKN